MRKFGIYSLLVGSVFALLLISVGVMGWNAYGLSKKESTDLGDKIWKDYKWWMYGPVATNAIAMMVLGILFAMG